MHEHRDTHSHADTQTHSVVFNKLQRFRKITSKWLVGVAIKRYSENELSCYSLLWRGRSRNLTAREEGHKGQRLWNYLGWHSFAFPFKILPREVVRRLRIDVNMDERMPISQYPTAASNQHSIPLLNISVPWERAGERFWWAFRGGTWWRSCFGFCLFSFLVFIFFFF